MRVKGTLTGCYNGEMTIRVGKVPGDLIKAMNNEVHVHDLACSQSYAGDLEEERDALRRQVEIFASDMKRMRSREKQVMGSPVGELVLKSEQLERLLAAARRETNQLKDRCAAQEAKLREMQGPGSGGSVRILGGFGGADMTSELREALDAVLYGTMPRALSTFAEIVNAEPAKPKDHIAERFSNMDLDEEKK